LRKYVEKMVFVPPYLMNEIADNDCRSRYTMKWFLCTPGLVYADEIYVQSEQMKKVYVEILDEFTGHTEKNKWNERILTTEFPLNKWMVRQRLLLKSKHAKELLTKEGKRTEKKIYDEVVEVPEEWMAQICRGNGACKKIVLYYMSGSIIYEYKEKAIEKMKQIISLAEKKKDDIIFIYRTDSYIQDILKRRLPVLWNSYRELLAEFKERGGILDESEDYTLAVKLCDAFYGDAGIIMSECRMQNKPVMWENPEIELSEV